MPSSETTFSQARTSCQTCMSLSDLPSGSTFLHGLREIVPLEVRTSSVLSERLATLITMKTSRVKQKAMQSQPTTAVT